MAIFYSGSLISGAFGNLIAAGILNGLAGVHGYAAWQWLYIVEGVITVFVSQSKRAAGSVRILKTLPSRVFSTSRSTSLTNFCSSD